MPFWVFYIQKPNIKQINYPNEKDFSFVGLRGNDVYIYRLFER